MDPFTQSQGSSTSLSSDDEAESDDVHIDFVAGHSGGLQSVGGLEHVDGGVLGAIRTNSRQSTLGYVFREADADNSPDTDSSAESATATVTARQHRASWSAGRRGKVPPPLNISPMAQQQLLHQRAQQHRRASHLVSHTSADHKRRAAWVRSARAMFVQLQCSVRLAGQLCTCTVRTLPACLAELLLTLNLKSNSYVDLTEMEIYLDVCVLGMMDSNPSNIISDTLLLSESTTPTPSNYARTVSPPQSASTKVHAAAASQTQVVFNFDPDEEEQLRSASQQMRPSDSLNSLPAPHRTALHWLCGTVRALMRRESTLALTRRPAANINGDVVSAALAHIKHLLDHKIELNVCDIGSILSHPKAKQFTIKFVNGGKDSELYLQQLVNSIDGLENEATFSRLYTPVVHKMSMNAPGAVLAANMAANVAARHTPPSARKRDDDTRGRGKSAHRQLDPQHNAKEAVGKEFSERRAASADRVGGQVSAKSVDASPEKTSERKSCEHPESHFRLMATLRRAEYAKERSRSFSAVSPPRSKPVHKLRKPLQPEQRPELLQPPMRLDSIGAAPTAATISFGRPTSSFSSIMENVEASDAGYDVDSSTSSDGSVTPSDRPNAGNVANEQKARLVDQDNVSQIHNKFTTDFWLIVKFNEDLNDGTSTAVVYFYERYPNVHERLFKALQTKLTEICIKINQRILLRELLQTQECSELLVPPDAAPPGRASAQSRLSTHRSTLSGPPRGPAHLLSQAAPQTGHIAQRAAAAVAAHHGASHVGVLDTAPPVPEQFAKDHKLWRSLDDNGLTESEDSDGEIGPIAASPRRGRAFLLPSRDNQAVSYKLGDFACPVVWKDFFAEHPRLNMGPMRSNRQRDAQSSVERVLRSCILHKFAVKNRPNMYVVHDRTADAVFYIRLRRAEDGRSRTGLWMFVYGVQPPSADLTVDFRNACQRRLDEIILESISLYLTKNPGSRLMPEDVSFMQADKANPTRVLQLPMSALLLPYLPAIAAYLKQHLLKFTVAPNFLLSSGQGRPVGFEPYASEHRSQLTINATQFFVFARPLAAGNRGIACMAQSFVDQNGRTICLVPLSSVRPCAEPSEEVGAVDWCPDTGALLGSPEAIAEDPQCAADAMGRLLNVSALDGRFT